MAVKQEISLNGRYIEFEWQRNAEGVYKYTICKFGLVIQKELRK